MAGTFASASGSKAAHAVIFAGLLVLATSAGIVVADPADGSSLADWELTLRARTALWDEPTFAKLNLGITIKQGIATLHGAVPSTAVAVQAIERLKKVPGLRSVVNETYVPPADEPVTQSMPHPVTAQRPTVMDVASQSDPPSHPVVPPTTPMPPVTVPAAANREPPGPFFPPIATPVQRETIGEQIERLRQSERRYQNISAQVQDGRVWLRGTVSRPQDMMDFAGQVRRLPGVTSVLLPQRY